MTNKSGRIAVIGDVMLDKYDFTKNRHNPESSAPAVTLVRREYKPGGAGNVASNLRSLGSYVDLVSVVGTDYHSSVLRNVLRERGVNGKLIMDKSRPTIVKMRIIDYIDGRVHLREDEEETHDIAKEHTNEIMRAVKSNGYSLILVSDYNKGIVTRHLMDELRVLGIPIIVDPKEPHKNFYHDVFLVKPNLLEARNMTGLENDVAAAERLRDELRTNILLTGGEKGVRFFGLKGERFDFPSDISPEKVKDATGAGDTFIATFAHFFVKGNGLRDCVRLANKAAGISVCNIGCYSVKEKELE